MHYAIDARRAQTGPWDRSASNRVIDPARVTVYRFWTAERRDEWTRINFPNHRPVTEAEAMDYVRQQPASAEGRWEADFVMGAPGGGEVRT